MRLRKRIPGQAVWKRNSHPQFVQRWRAGQVHGMYQNKKREVKYGNSRFDDIGVYNNNDNISYNIQ